MKTASLNQFGSTGHYLADRTFFLVATATEPTQPSDLRTDFATNQSTE